MLDCFRFVLCIDTSCLCFLCCVQYLVFIVLVGLFLFRLSLFLLFGSFVLSLFCLFRVLSVFYCVIGLFGHYLVFLILCWLDCVLWGIWIVSFRFGLRCYICLVLLCCIWFCLFHILGIFLLCGQLLVGHCSVCIWVGLLCVVGIRGIAMYVLFWFLLGFFGLLPFSCLSRECCRFGLS